MVEHGVLFVVVDCLMMNFGHNHHYWIGLGTSAFDNACRVTVNSNSPDYVIHNCKCRSCRISKNHIHNNIFYIYIYIIQFFISYWILLWSFLYYINFISIPPLVETIYSALFISTYLLYIFEIKKPIIYIISIFFHLIPFFFVKKYYDKYNDKIIVKTQTLYFNTLILVFYATITRIIKKNIITFYKNFTIFVKNNNLYNITKYLLKI